MRKEEEKGAIDIGINQRSKSDQSSRGGFGDQFARGEWRGSSYLRPSSRLKKR